MKRFFSLLCAVALVLSTTAAPQFKSFNPVAQPKVSVAKVVKPSGMKTAVPVKITDKKQVLEQNSVRKVAKAPKAKQTTTNVAVSKASATYYAADNDIYYALYNEDKSVIYCFDIVCAEGQEDVVSGQTYTLADMLSTYCEWVYASDVNNGTAFTAASFTKTVAADGSYTIVASATDENGDVFNLSYAESAFVPQTYNLTMAKASFEYSSSYSDMYVSMNDADENYYFYFDILLPSGQKTLESGKTYTLADMDADYTKGADYVNMEYINFASASFTRIDAVDGSFTVSAVVVDKKGNTWNISYSQAAPEISYQSLTLNGTAEPGSSYSLIEAANADTTIYVSLFLYSSSLEGSFTEEDLITYYSLSYILFGGVEYDIEAANFTVAYSEQAGAYIVSGTVNGVDPDDATNQVVFTITLTCQGPAPAAKSDMTFQFQLTDSSIIIKPSVNDELWDWYLADTATYNYYGADYIASAIYSNYGTQYATSGEYEMTFEYLYSQGYSAGEQVLIIWGCDDNGVTTDAATLAFTLPEKQYVSDMTFAFQYTDTSVIVIPSNNTELWAYYLVDSATYNDYCGNNPDYVASVIYSNQGTTYADTASIEFSLESMVAAGYNGKVYLIVWGCDENQVTTKAAECVIILPEKQVVPSDMEFSFTPFSGGVTVTPSNNVDPWDFAIITAAQFASIGNDADFVAEYFYSENGDDNAYPGPYDLIYSENGVTEDGSYVLIVWGANGGVTTPAAVYAFSIGDETAIDEIDAAVKANKVIRNGQLFIEKGSVRFNANGILVK